MSLYNARTTPGATGNTGTGFYLIWQLCDWSRCYHARRKGSKRPPRFRYRTRP